MNYGQPLLNYGYPLLNIFQYLSLNQIKTLQRHLMASLIYQGHGFQVLPCMRGKYHIHRVVALMAWPFNDINFVRFTERENTGILFKMSTGKKNRIKKCHVQKNLVR